MKLHSLNEHIELTETSNSLLDELKMQHPGLTEKELQHYIKAIYFNGHDGGITESMENFDELNEVVGTLLKARKIKKTQKKANKAKLDSVEVESSGDKRKQKLDDNKNLDRTSRSDQKKKIDDMVTKKQKVISSKVSELESVADEKATTPFLKKFTAKLRIKGTLAALEADLESASDAERTSLKAQINKTQKREEEASAELDKLAKAEKAKKAKEDEGKKSEDDEKKSEGDKENKEKIEKLQDQADETQIDIDFQKKELADIEAGSERNKAEKELATSATALKKLKAKIKELKG